MQVIPLLPIPAQDLTCVLNGQNCAISVYTKATGTFLDLSVSGTPVITGMICRSSVLLVRLAYLGFLGDLMFLDTQGNADPAYTGFGSRWQLVYLAPGD
ncbi:MAG: hypothetical protein KGH75_06500 [Rhodospirillales bacterium]|nr:hypothetical protein [Rhodospirillales bacterium]